MAKGRGPPVQTQRVSPIPLVKLSYVNKNYPVLFLSKVVKLLGGPQSFNYPKGRRDSDNIIPLKVLGFCLFSTQAAGK